MFNSANGPQGLLQRAMTFDERKSLQAESKSVFKFEPIAKGKRALTFAGDGDTSSLPPIAPIQYSDVLYRRYFGEEEKPFVPLNRNLSFATRKSAPVTSEKQEQGVVVVDTFSTGSMVADLLYRRGYKIVRVFSGDLGDLLDFIPDGLIYVPEVSFIYDDKLDQNVAVSNIIASLEALPFPIVSVIAGAETGVELSDLLSERMGLITNGTRFSEARRNKYVMGETVRDAGVRAVKQLRASVWRDVEAFIFAWNPHPFKVIVKPMDSAGSDDVTLCLSIKDVQNAFGNIMGKVNQLGLVNKEILVQEYLEGQEYVVDIVSKNGEHKVAALWAYDRRPANGAQFVNFGQKLLSADDPKCREIIEYQFKVINALGIRNGPTHGEVKWFKNEPVLVEVGARCHGGDGLWLDLEDECFGYNQAKCTVDAYLNPRAFDLLPDLPDDRLAYGSQKWLIHTGVEGILKGIDEDTLKEITSMESYRSHQIFKEAGDPIKKTMNCFSWAGCVNLCNKSEAALNRDYRRVEELEATSLFIVEPTADSLDPETSKPRAVAVVDPFSTGASMASILGKRGFKVIAVYSANLEQLGNLQSLVPQGLKLKFDHIMGYTDPSSMAEELSNLDWPIVSVIAGAETGVELADNLSERMGLITNGTRFSEARRNKYVMGETVRDAGVRAVKQLRASTWDEVVAFIHDWNPSPFQVIVKPLDSAGADDVTLCHDLGEIQVAFNRILGKTNGLGLKNNSVLIQEYLEGQEYVVDTVSHNGEHKVVALWAYDRRAANGAGFVVHGQQLLTSDEPFCRELIDYQKKVLDALGIKYGPTHGEVKMCRGEPVLVEIGARCHGVEGAWIEVCNGVYGYNQADGAINSFLDREAFAKLPPEPTQRFGYGRLLFICVKNRGQLEQINEAFTQEILGMNSVIHLEYFVKVGSTIVKTIDGFTLGGLVRLYGIDPDSLAKDYDRIRDLENLDWFICN